MSHPYAEEIQANLERAEETRAAARLLMQEGFFDSAASRAYYAAFYAATAALLYEQETFKTHGGVLSSFHRVFVKSGRVRVEHGKRLNQLSELRSIGDYGEIHHVPQHEAERAVEDASAVIEAVRRLL